MKKMFGIFAFILILLLLSSGMFTNLGNFFSWLFTLEYITPGTSTIGSIIVKILTFVVSYMLVGIIFNAFEWFNSNIMKLVYFIISTILGFLLAFVVMIIEEYFIGIGIVLGIVFIISIVFLILNHIMRKKL